jgi:hypothetical protein
VQVEPLNPTLKAPRIKGLKLKCDKLLSILLKFCFQNQLAPLDSGDLTGSLRSATVDGALGSGARW